MTAMVRNTAPSRDALHIKFGYPAGKKICAFGQGFRLISPKRRSQWRSNGTWHCTIQWCTTTTPSLV